MVPVTVLDMEETMSNSEDSISVSPPHAVLLSNRESSGISELHATLGLNPPAASVNNLATPPTVAIPVLSLVNEDDDRRYCWVCFATDEDDQTATWVQPCRCKGTTKWVHQLCIQRWIDEKQKGNTSTKVSCPQCNTEYAIVFPEMGPVVFVLDSVDNMIYKVCPFIVAGVVVGSIYWTAVTYGAVTIMQVIGHKKGLAVMEQADPLVLLVGLPTIPITLILGKMIRWEDSILRFLRKTCRRLPLLSYLLPSFNVPEIAVPNQDIPPLSDPVSATRVLCGALLLPTLAHFFGDILFETVESNIHRTVLGGIAFITIKGALKIYHKQQQFIRQSKRQILDFKVESETTTEIAEPPQDQEVQD